MSILNPKSEAFAALERGQDVCVTGIESGQTTRATLVEAFVADAPKGPEDAVLIQLDTDIEELNRRHITMGAVDLVNAEGTPLLSRPYKV